VCVCVYVWWGGGGKERLLDRFQALPLNPLRIGGGPAPVSFLHYVRDLSLMDI